MIGPPGAGKTHLAIGMRAAGLQKRVLFFTAEKLIEERQAAEVSGKPPSFMDLMGRVDLLIIDELGYLKLTRQSAELFFKLNAKRYEKGSVIVTSNKALNYGARYLWMMWWWLPSWTGCFTTPIRFLFKGKVFV